MRIDDLLQTALNAIDIVPDDDESVFFDTVSIVTDAPNAVDAVLEVYTKQIDTMLRTLPLTDSDYMQLLISRCFTYAEYQSLWNNYKQTDYKNRIIYKVLLIGNEQDRLLFTSVRNNTYEGFIQFLESYTKVCNPLLHHFFYEES